MPVSHLPSEQRISREIFYALLHSLRPCLLAKGATSVAIGKEGTTPVPIQHLTLLLVLLLSLSNINASTTSALIAAAYRRRITPYLYSSKPTDVLIYKFTDKNIFGKNNPKLKTSSVIELSRSISYNIIGIVILMRKDNDVVFISMNCVCLEKQLNTRS